VRWSVVMPVKRLEQAKSRLAVTAEDRVSLALAMALDTASVALGSPRVGLLVVVSDDPVAGPALAALGAVVLADEPDAGLNAALSHGAAAATARAPAYGVAFLTCDLPALQADELTRAFDLAGNHERALVADAGGDGTTLLTAAPGVAPRPSFGAGSRARHADEGAVVLAARRLAGLRRDVDTVADLQAARRLGVGPRTAFVLSRERR